LLRIHNMHRPALEQVLIALASAGEASYLAMVTNEHPAAANGQPRDLGDVMYAKYQEFWLSIGREVSARHCTVELWILVTDHNAPPVLAVVQMIGIAAQYGCGDSASLALYSVLNSYQAAAVAAGQFNAGISTISPHSTSRGPFLVDMRIFLDKIIQPVASEIARLN
jgi:hypothetical protein